MILIDKNDSDYQFTVWYEKSQKFIIDKIEPALKELGIKYKERYSISYLGYFRKTDLNEIWLDFTYNKIEYTLCCSSMLVETNEPYKISISKRKDIRADSFRFKDLNFDFIEFLKERLGIMLKRKKTQNSSKFQYLILYKNRRKEK